MAEENEEQQPLPENENQPQTVAPKKKILLLWILSIQPFVLI